VYSRAESDADFTLATVITELSDLSYEETIPTENIGLTYYFKVSGVNEVGEGTLSSEASIIAGHEPSQPHNLQKVSADVDQITFMWQAPYDDGGTPILDYKIFWD